MLKNLTATLVAMMMMLVAATAFAAGGQYDSGFNGEYVEATGWGDMEGQSISDARECAIMDAEANLVGFMQGVHVDRDSIMEKHRLQSDTVVRKITGMVRYAEVYWEGQETGRYIVKMRVRAYGNPESSLAGLAFDKPWTPEPLPQPSTTTTTTTTQQTQTTTNSTTYGYGSYTGLVIDCRGLNISTAMSPVIRDENHRAIYGHKNLNYDYVVSHGMAGYSHGDATLSRAGSHPMVVKAVSVDGYFYPVVSQADADAILLANQNNHFLDRAAVVIMRD